jgi:UDP-glucuronate 4-epimerase
MKILITGVAGFIGFHTAKKLLEEGHEVVGLDNINYYYNVNLKYSRLKELGINRNDIVSNKFLLSKKYNFKFIKADLEDATKIEKLFMFDKFDKVIHLAAQAGVRYSIENPTEYIMSNILAFNILLEIFKDKTEHIIYASSSSVYGNNITTPFTLEQKTDKPSNMYAVTKKTKELMAYAYESLYGIKCTGLRFFTVYGPFGRPDMAYYLFTEKILNGEKIEVFGNGELKRDFTYIDDIVDGINKVVNYDKNLLNDLYNFGNENPVSVLNLIEIIERKLEKKAIIELLPKQLGEVKETYADIAISKTIGYNPQIKIDEGIDRFTRWYLLW